ncbi:hypothetical protein B0H16DRAFT_1468060 [Mycena metata]|uniref:Restriction of telomere capping protein 4 C-terminal domain-containing protein n=1 Tax=Mycena metata TaxID=1033252 RepID=A0AAD7I463_9AGAR|nr:hypothetical protein B0H16DRAFT_1468060 [Mycena metata]
MRDKAPLPLAEQLLKLQAKITAQKQEIESLRKSAKKKSLKLIPRPAGQSGRANGYELIKEMRLTHNKPQYHRLSRIVRSYTLRYLNGHKTILKQKVARVDKVIELLMEKYPYLARFDGGWPIRDLMKKVLQNSVNALKVDDKAEGLANEDAEVPVSDEEAEAEGGEIEGEEGEVDVVEADEEDDAEEVDEENSVSHFDSDHEMSDIEGEGAFEDALGSDDDSDDEIPVPKNVSKPAKKPSKPPSAPDSEKKKRKLKHQVMEDAGTNPPQKKARTDGVPAARPQSKPKSSPPTARQAAKPVLTPPRILTKCPKLDCADLLPKKPLSADLARLISQRNKIVNDSNPHHSTHALEKVDQKICETISLEHKRRKLATMGRNLGWPLSLDFPQLLTRIVALKDDLFELVTDPESLGQSISFLDFLNTIDGQINEFVEQGFNNFPLAITHSRAGYLGQHGVEVIGSTIIRLFAPHFPRLRKELSQTITALIHAAPEHFDFPSNPNQKFIPFPLEEFIEFVLIPHVSTCLIAEDMQVTFTEAVEIRAGSTNFGDVFHADPKDPHFLAIEEYNRLLTDEAYRAANPDVERKYTPPPSPAPPTPKKHKKKVKLPSSPPEEVELTLDDFPQVGCFRPIMFNFLTILERPKKSKAKSKAKQKSKSKSKAAENSTAPAKSAVPAKKLKAPPTKKKVEEPPQPAAQHGYGTRSSKGAVSHPSRAKNRNSERFSNKAAVRAVLKFDDPPSTLKSSQDITFFLLGAFSGSLDHTYDSYDLSKAWSRSKPPRTNGEVRRLMLIQYPLNLPRLLGLCPEEDVGGAVYSSSSKDGISSSFPLKGHWKGLDEYLDDVLITKDSLLLVGLVRR